MKNFLIRLVINILALLVVVNILPGASIKSWSALIVAAIVIAIFNAILKPILIILTLPINILTIGLFTLIINAFLLYLTAVVVHGFYIHGFWNAFFGGIIFSIVSIFLSMFIGTNKTEVVAYHNN